jgi:hypothetical protein
MKLQFSRINKIKNSVATIFDSVTRIEIPGVYYGY